MNNMQSDDAQKDPEQLEQEVRDAREQLSHTVDEISNRLSPGELLDQALNTSKTYGGDLARNLGQQAKDNPLALMVTGVGMAWMMLGNQQQDQQRSDLRSSTDTDNFQLASGSGRGDHYDRDIGDLSHAATGSVNLDLDTSDQENSGHDSVTGHQGHSEDDGASLSDKLSQHLPDMPDGDQLKSHAKSAQTQLQRTLEEQPLMVGALGVAFGAALGALLPPSDVEDRLMGEKSDEVTEKATQMAADQYKSTREAVREKVSEAADQVNANQLADDSQSSNS